MSGVLVSLNRFFPIQLLAMLGAVCVISAEAGLPAARGQESAFYACRQLGRGVNLGNFLEPPRGADWGVKIEGKHLEAIKQAGFDSVRLPVRWADYASSEFPFSVEPAFFGRVDHLLDVAESHKLNVVLNIHHFDRLVEEPDVYLLKFESLWKQIATRYKKRGEFLYFELNNEPHGQLDASWNEVLKVGLSAVRQSNPRRPKRNSASVSGVQPSVTGVAFRREAFPTANPIGVARSNTESTGTSRGSRATKESRDSDSVTVSISPAFSVHSLVGKFTRDVLRACLGSSQSMHLRALIFGSRICHTSGPWRILSRRTSGESEQTPFCHRQNAPRVVQ